MGRVSPVLAQARQICVKAWAVGDGLERKRCTVLQKAGVKSPGRRHRLGWGRRGTATEQKVHRHSKGTKREREEHKKAKRAGSVPALKRGASCWIEDSHSPGPAGFLILSLAHTTRTCKNTGCKRQAGGDSQKIASQFQKHCTDAAL